MELSQHSQVPIAFLLVLGSSLSASGQMVGETADQNFGQIFSRVDSHLNGDLFQDFVDFTGGDFLDYDDLMPSESALTEQQLTDRQTKLRELYRGRRPIGGGKVSPRVSFFNRLKKGKEKTEEKRDPIKEKILDKFQSGMAVTVVKPPPDYEPPKSTENKKDEEKKQEKEKEVVSVKPHKNPLKDWRGKQKQREAVATSLIGSRLKDLKEKRKQFMNSNLVTDQNVEADNFRPAERIDKDFESFEELNAQSGAQLVKVQIEEKSSESHFKFPSKKRRFKPQIKSATASPKWSIKEKFKNKHKHKLEIPSKTKVETNDDIVAKKNQKSKKIIKDPVTEPPLDVKEMKIDDMQVDDQTTNTSREDVKSEDIVVSEEILDEVYGKLGGLYDKVSKLKETEEKEKDPVKEKEEKKPSWMSSPRKKSTPLKHIDAEESALPLSIIPHGVPVTRGFPQTSSQPKVLVLPTSSTSLTPRPVRPAFSQFLSFGPVTATPLPITTTTVSEAFKDKLKTLIKKEDSVASVEGFSEEETAELTREEENTKDEKKMTADMINSNIEEVLDIKMPNYTKLLYGDNDGQRFERNSNSSIDESKPYSFNYSILDEKTGVTHSRDETSDEKGVIRGSYEIGEPGCIIRRVDYQADHQNGFKVLEISRRPCTESKEGEVTEESLEVSEQVTEKMESEVRKESLEIQPRENIDEEREEEEEKEYYPNKKEENEEEGKGKEDDEKKEVVILKETDGNEAAVDNTKKEKEDMLREAKLKEVIQMDEDKEEAAVDDLTEKAEQKEDIIAVEEVSVEGREGKEADTELIEAEESREVFAGESRRDSAEDRLFIDLASLVRKPSRPPPVQLSSGPHSSGPDIQYGGFKPAGPSSSPGVAPVDSYGAPVADPVSSYDPPAAQAPDSYGSPLAQPLPNNGVKVVTPVENFISQVVPEAKSVVDDNNYDPFVFQAAGQPNDDAKTGNLQLGNNNNNILADGQNKQLGAQNNFINDDPAFDTSLNEPLVIGSNNNDNIFNPFGVSVATAHDPTQRPNNFPSTTEGPSSIVVTPFSQQQINSNPPRPSGTPPSRPQTFFPSTQAPQRPATTTRRTTRRTTSRSVLLQQNNPFTNSVDEGLRNPADFAVLDFGSPTLQPFQRPEKLTIAGDRPKVNELNGNSGIFFSTPSTTFVTPPNFATPGPTGAPDQFQQLNLEQEVVRGPFSVDQVVTTTASPFPFPQTTLRGRGEAVTGTPRPVFSPVSPQTNFFHIGNSQNNLFENVTPQNTLTNSVTPQSNFGVSNSVRPQFPSSFGSTAAPSPALFTNNVPPARSGPTRKSQNLNLGQRPANFNSFVLGSSGVNGNKRKSNTGRLSSQVGNKEEEESQAEALRRNMLMNIILRPGGGDRAKALPRPKVEVNSEGSNVIVVRLTFPDNENIQGLRAFTPTEPKDLQKFAELRKAISSEDASVERLTAISSEEENFLSEEEIKEKLVQNPTRPPRPVKAKKPSLSYLPPGGAQTTKNRNQGFNFQLPNRSPKHFSGGKSRLSGEVINMIDNKEAGFFKFKALSEESEEGGISRIKPRQPQDPPPPSHLPSSFEKGSKELVPFRPSEAFNEHKFVNSGFPKTPKRPVRPPRPPKPLQVVNNFVNPPRPLGPPPNKLPLRGVQLTKTGRKHPGIVFQSRKDSPPRSYYPLLKQAWKGLLL